MERKGVRRACRFECVQRVEGRRRPANLIVGFWVSASRRQWVLTQRRGEGRCKRMREKETDSESEREDEVPSEGRGGYGGAIRRQASRRRYWPPLRSTFLSPNESFPLLHNPAPRHSIPLSLSLPLPLLLCPALC